MVESQEIVERSLYSSLLSTLLRRGLTLDPELYQPPSDVTALQYKTDKQLIIDDKKYFITLFGAGNNQAKGEMVVPRIVIVPKGYLPGDVGLERTKLTQDEDSKRYFVSEFPYEAIDQFIDIHLIANTQESIRMMQIILEQSIPVRGYIKPYIFDEVPFDGNIFTELVNFFDAPNLDKGVLEKVYQYQIKDTLLYTEDLPETLPPLVDITLLLSVDDEPEKELIHITT